MKSHLLITSRKILLLKLTTTSFNDFAGLQYEQKYRLNFAPYHYTRPSNLRSYFAIFLALGRKFLLQNSPETTGKQSIFLLIFLMVVYRQ